GVGLRRQRRAHRDVPDVLVRTAVGRRTGARVPGPLVHGDEVHAGLALDERLRAVAMVHVPVDDENALETVLDTRVVRRDGDVADEAEAHRAIAEGVVTGRPDGTERALGAAVHGHVDGIE